MPQQTPDPNAKLEHLATLLDLPQYGEYSSSWPTDRAAGYTLWFEERMMMRSTERRLRLVTAGRFNAIENVPQAALATPLLRTVQLLERHRDVMFCDDLPVKPSTMVIATLAAQAYASELDLYPALLGILNRLPAFIGHRTPRVPNPIAPGEDFADAWATDADLEFDFRSWHMQASDDFYTIATETDENILRKLLESRLGLTLDEDAAREMLNASTVPNSSMGGMSFKKGWLELSAAL